MVKVVVRNSRKHRGRGLSIVPVNLEKAPMSDASSLLKGGKYGGTQKGGQTGAAKKHGPKGANRQRGDGGEGGSGGKKKNNAKGLGFVRSPGSKKHLRKLKEEVCDPQWEGGSTSLNFYKMGPILGQGAFGKVVVAVRHVVRRMVYCCWWWWCVAYCCRNLMAVSCG